jgi:hypothetical protein
MMMGTRKVTMREERPTVIVEMVERLNPRAALPILGTAADRHATAARLLYPRSLLATIRTR